MQSEVLSGFQKKNPFHFEDRAKKAGDVPKKGFREKARFHAKFHTHTEEIFGMIFHQSGLCIYFLLEKKQVWACQ